jgi:hypothetical protein
MALHSMSGSVSHRIGFVSGDLSAFEELCFVSAFATVGATLGLFVRDGGEIISCCKFLLLLLWSSFK